MIGFVRMYVVGFHSAVGSISLSSTSSSRSSLSCQCANYRRLVLLHPRARSKQKFRRHYSVQMSSQKEKPGGQSQTHSIAWFRSDLRVYDNQMLVEAAKLNSGRVLPVYCFDPRIFEATTSLGGFPKTGVHRTRFVLESVVDLRRNLETLGSTLIVRVGKPEEILPKIAQEFNCSHVLCSEEVCSEELSVENAVSNELSLLPSKVIFKRVWGSVTLFHVEDLPMSIEEIPNIFSNFRRRVESICDVRNPIPPPENLVSVPQNIDIGQLPTVESLLKSHLGSSSFDITAQIDARSVLQFSGGETAGRARVQYYIWDSDLIATYKDTRNGMIGGDYSSKFSVWLAHGCVSSRWIYSEIKKYENRRVSNNSTYWLVFELIWRDYFRFAAMKYGTSIFFQGGPRQRTDVRWKSNPKAFAAWKDGMTGFPLVDANMRELEKTGFMSNRGRQNVASFLAKDLGIDWRLGAEWFESCLLDYDPCSNYGNWNYSAGVGDDPREDRHFNVVKQAKTYDENGDYAKLWIPELKDVPTENVYEPYRVAETELLQKYSVQLGDTYPRPIIQSFGRSKFPLNTQMGKGKKHEGPSKARGRNTGKDKPASAFERPKRTPKF